VYNLTAGFSTKSFSKQLGDRGVVGGGRGVRVVTVVSDISTDYNNEDIT